MAEARVRLQLRGRMLPAARTPRSEEDQGNGSREGTGSTRGRWPRREPAAARRAADASGREDGGRLASPGSVLQKEKRLLVTGRERRWPRAHAPPPPPEHTPGPAAAAYLPRRPASFLCWAQAAPAASGAHGSDEPLTQLRPASRSRPELAVSNPLPAVAAASSNSAPAARDSFPCARSSSAGQRPRLRPRPASPAPEPSPTSARGSAPLRWHRALRRCHSPRGLRARRPAGRSSVPADSSCGPVRLPPPAAGMPWATRPSALGFRPPAGPGCFPPRAEPAAGRLRDRRRQVCERPRTSSDLEAASLIAVS